MDEIPVVAVVAVEKLLEPQYPARFAPLDVVKPEPLVNPLTAVRLLEMKLGVKLLVVMPPPVKLDAFHVTIGG